MGPGAEILAAIEAVGVAATGDFLVFSVAAAAVLGGEVTTTWVKIDVAISLSAVSSYVLVNLNQVSRSTSSLSSRRRTLRESSSLGERFGFPLSGVSLDG